MTTAPNPDAKTTDYSWLLWVGIAAFCALLIYSCEAKSAREDQRKRELLQNFKFEVDGGTGDVKMRPKYVDWKNRVDQTQKKYGERPIYSK
jgi:hypothetical protein